MDDAPASDLNTHQWAAHIAALRTAGQLDEALHALAQAWQQHPGAVDLLIAGAHVAQARGDAAAAELWADAQRLHPAHAGVWLGQAQALRAIGDHSGALAILTDSPAFANAPGFIWMWGELLDLAITLGQDARAYQAWCDMRVALPNEALPVQRMWTVRLLWRQRAPEDARALLALLIAQPLDEVGVPALWQFAKELQTRTRAGWQDEGLALVIAEQIGVLCAAGAAYPALQAAMFHLPVSPSALLADGWSLLSAGLGGRLGCLRELNQTAGRALIGSLAYLTVTGPEALAPEHRLELLRLALADCPDGADTLLRQMRTRPAPDANETTAPGLLAALCERLRPRGDLPPRPAHRRLRIALCVSGQLRGYAQAHAGWGALGLAAHDVVTFVHSWRAIGRRQLDAPGFITGRLFPPPIEAAYHLAWMTHGGRNGVVARYPALAALFDDQAVIDSASLERFYQTPHVVLEDDNAAPFSSFTNQEKMFYKIAAAQTLADAQGEFDLIMRIRPDKELLTMGTPDWLEMSSQSPVFRELYNDTGVHYVMSGLGMGDQMAVGAADVMRDYAGLWAARDAAKPFGAPARIESHSSIIHHLFARGVRVRVWPGLWGGRLFDAAMIPPAALAAALRQDIGGSRDPADVAFIEACASLGL